ncbi:MAG: transcriptional regulator [Chloroflexi bacterium]|nr:transcriptional regulator [Chloroflexota bacterium]
MYRKGLVVRTKLTPPRLHKRTLHRARLTRRLLEALDYRLAIVQAGAGYGKSTALAALVESGCPLAWYHLGAEDTDPLVFLLHLFHSFRTALPGLSEAPLALLEAWEREGSDLPWAAVVDVLINQLVEQADVPVLLILDDFHLLSNAAGPVRILDWFIGRAPPDLHVILSTRYPPKLPTLVTWRVKGEVLEIGQEELAFMPQEIASLFREQYDLSLTTEEVELLAAKTEGWAIALQLVWQGLRGGAVSTLSQALERLSGPSKNLFAYLSQEVLERQPPDVQEFLLVTAILREMTATVCDCLRDANDSDQILHYLLESGLFAIDLGSGHARYQSLFRDFLCHRLSPQAARRAHRKAADCWQQRDEQEEAIYHLLAANAFEEVACILDQLGRDMVREGRLDTLAGWIGDLSPVVLERHPLLLVYLGDVARLHSRFDKALDWYRQAEKRCRARGDMQGTGQALRGQARVYLDTVNPRQAEHLLQEALQLSDGQEDRESRARLLELLAENLLNLGRLEEAERLQAQFKELREKGPGRAELAVRVLLRTGQLDQARHLLEERAQIEQQTPILRPRSHRETLLLLSLILSFQGEGEKAYRCAVEGTERGQALHSPFVTAVGYMRQGHAWLLRKAPQGYDEACRCFREAIALGDTLAVPRLKVEAFWGLCRAHGFQGEIQEAEEAARQGIEIAQRAGDEWIAALIRVSMGGGYTLAQRYADASSWLSQAANAFRECGDTFGEAVSWLWQCLVWQDTEDVARLEHGVDKLLQLVCEHGYTYLFTRNTLLEPPDHRRTIPLLLFARDHTPQSIYARRILAQMGLERLESHPGYQLRVQTLGPFRVWRGAQEIAPHEWRREKARQLFQLLLTYRGEILDRDQIVELLWPGLAPEPARRDFRVALSTLFQVLEPDRRRGAPSAYVLRDGSLYGLRSGADLWLDAEQFERLVAEGDRHFDHNLGAGIDCYRQALAFYQGEYLQECPYEDWCSEERERLLTLYLRAADRLACALVEREQWEEAIAVCQSILARDDCWEQAYRLMMIAYAHLGNRAQALRTYQRCVKRLRERLEIEPSADTVRLYESILQPARDQE